MSNLMTCNNTTPLEEEVEQSVDAPLPEAPQPPFNIPGDLLSLLIKKVARPDLPWELEVKEITNEENAVEQVTPHRFVALRFYPLVNEGDDKPIPVAVVHYRTANLNDDNEYTITTLHEGNVLAKVEVMEKHDITWQKHVTMMIQSFTTAVESSIDNLPRAISRSSVYWATEGYVAEAIEKLSATWKQQLRNGDYRFFADDTGALAGGRPLIGRIGRNAWVEDVIINVNATGNKYRHVEDDSRFQSGIALAMVNPERGALLIVTVLNKLPPVAPVVMELDENNPTNGIILNIVTASGGDEPNESSYVGELDKFIDLQGLAGKLVKHWNGRAFDDESLSTDNYIQGAYDIIDNVIDNFDI